MTMMSRNKDARIVITGLGTVNPLGNTVREFWDNLKTGKSGVRTIQNVDIDNYGIRIAGEVDPPDPTLYFKENFSTAIQFSKISNFGFPL